MKKWAVLSILVLATQAAIAGGASRYHDPSYGYTVTPPVFPEGPALGVPITPVKFAGAPKDGEAPFCNVQIQSAAMTQATFLEVSRNQFTALGGTVVSEDTRKVSGKPAALWHVRLGLAEMLVLVTFGEKHVYLLTCASQAMQYLDWEEQFKKTIDSFSLD